MAVMNTAVAMSTVAVMNTVVVMNTVAVMNTVVATVIKLFKKPHQHLNLEPKNAFLIYFLI